MIPSAHAVLEALRTAAPRRTSEAPNDCRGIYGLIDHLGDLRYIGSTSSADETFYKRIHRRHRTGSEGSSHYFSRMYNTGRMWRRPNDPDTKADGDIAKRLRNAFVAEHCRAVWFPLPDSLDIAALERAVLSIAPPEVVAWNRRGMQAYKEPEVLVDAVIQQLGFGAAERAALGRQSARYLNQKGGGAGQPSSPLPHALPPFPEGPFRFFALDVETANHQRSSICQVGVACVCPDNSIETWMTFVDPGTSDWSCSWVHGITAATVRGAPTFAAVMGVLEQALEGHVVYQHSSFDRSAVEAACVLAGMVPPTWIWKDSVQVARQAWPELRGNGGHGLKSLKKHLGLEFTHHHAGEDARAAAEVVLLAERHEQRPVVASLTFTPEPDDFDVIEDVDDAGRVPLIAVPLVPSEPAGIRVLGTVQLTQGNITNNHIYLRSFFSAFPADAVGGSNRMQMGHREVAVDWGDTTPVMTDLDGQKKFFRKRSWIGDFFKRNGARAGDTVCVEQTGSYQYRVRLQKGEC